MTDYKQLCAELADVLAQYVNLPDDPEAVALLRHARAALAEPEPKESARLRTERRFGPFGEWTALVPCNSTVQAQSELL